MSCTLSTMSLRRVGDVPVAYVVIKSKPHRQDSEFVRKRKAAISAHNFLTEQNKTKQNKTKQNKTNVSGNTTPNIRINTSAHK